MARKQTSKATAPKKPGRPRKFVGEEFKAMNERQSGAIVEIETERYAQNVEAAIERIRELYRDELRARPPWIATYLAHLELVKGKAVAAQASGVSTSSIRMRRKDDKIFAELELDSIERYGDHLRGEALRRGRDGVIEPVFYLGVIVGGIRKYSDTLLAMELNATGRQEYQRFHKHSHQNAAPGGVLVAPKGLTPEEWIAEGVAQAEPEEEKTA